MQLGPFIIASLASMPLAVLAQTTVFTDNFAGDASDPSSSYLKGSSSSGTVVWTSGTGMTLGGAGTGKLADLIGSFSAVTLASTGDYVSFVVNFNSPNIGQGGTSLAGCLLFALDNSLGVSPTSLGPTEAVSSTSTGGATQGYLGYLGDIAFNNSPKTGTKFYAKTGSGNNNLSYNSNVSPKTQLSTSVNSANNANLVNNDSYTLTYTVAALNTGASQMQITASIYDNTLGAMQDNFTFGATNNATWITPTTTFDTFDIGLYTGSEPSGYSLNVTSASVLSQVATVPEPSTVTFCLGVCALAIARRFRH